MIKTENFVNEVMVVELNWMNPAQAAKLWGITDRRVQALCAAGRVPNAQRLGRGWLIPKDAPKPSDGRAKNGRKAQNKNPLLEK